MKHIIPCKIIQKFSDNENTEEEGTLNIRTHSVEVSNGNYPFLTDQELLDMEDEFPHTILTGWAVSFSFNGQEHTFDIHPIADNSDIEEYEEWKITANQPEYKAFILSQKLNEVLPYPKVDNKRKKI